MTLTKYGLRKKGTEKILNYSSSYNENADCCEETTYRLINNEEDDNQWLVNTYEKAEYVAYHQTAWFNAGYSTPMHEYNPEDLEIVKVTQVITNEIIIDDIIKVKLKEETLENEFYNVLTDYENSVLSFKSKEFKNVIIYVKDYNEKLYRIINTNNNELQFDRFGNRYIPKKDCELL